MLISQGCENSGIEEISRFERGRGKRGRKGEGEGGRGRGGGGEGGFDEFWSRIEIYNLVVERKNSGILTKAFCLC
ncbi:MAG: hypothetical protein EAZ90_17330 [Oscillatoriales cyanobacterium]|nr:MAG: hypothetical protein EAZ93_19745 [Oscillatoriales cyanobacterium]TAE41787.1 MAG: hypothetical protein EAZ90_17330 [Oscillatoriales cyanobacterium]TAF88704.1 MAG: hypothetical protein EAZ49_15490 [Oscillatoriales cyanobacterium]TAG60495.1 MAG: hypothetical protein EAZ25_33200 [Oscillatoriales cyanobacterium]TAG75752.1 MAG: hypothetical protein EAZ23_02010 [Oscillatoriales cyanobacterium]